MIPRRAMVWRGLLAALVAARLAAEEPGLRPGGSVDTRLAPASSAAFELELAAGEFVELLVAEQAGERIAIRLHAPGGRLVLEAQSPLEGAGPVLLAHVAEESGPHRVELARPDAGIGEVAVRLEVRGGTGDAARDRALARAARDWAEAAASVEPASLRRAMPARETWQHAEELFAAALAVWRSEGDGRRVALGLSSLAYAHEWQHEVDEEEAQLAEARALWEELGDRRALGWTLGSLGQVAQWRGRYDEAERWTAAAIDEFEALGDAGHAAQRALDLGLLRSASGRHVEALEVFARGLDRARRAGADALAASILVHSARVHAALGEHEEALALWAEALPAKQAAGDPLGVAQVLVYRARLLNALGEHDAALADLDRAAPLVESVANAGWQGFVAIGRCEALRETGRLEEADRACARARERFEAEGARWAVGMAISDRGAVLEAAGRLAEAEAAYVAALAIHRERRDALREAATLERLGRVRRRGGRPEAAAGDLAVALELWRRLARPEEAAATRLELARAERDRGRIEAALEEAGRAEAWIESSRSRLATAGSRAAYLATVRGVYELSLELRLGSSGGAPGARDASRAFEVSDRSRARVLLESLWNPLSWPEELAARERELRARLSGLQSRASEAARADPPRADAGVEAGLAALDREFDALERDLRRRSPWPALTPFAGADALRAVLADDVAFLQYAQLERDWALFVVTREGVDAVRLGNVGDLPARVGQMRAALERPSRLTGEVRRLGADLFRRLLAPVAAQVEGKRRLVVSPDGVLHYLPFEALIAPGAGGAASDYLLRRWEVSYAPSAAVALALGAARRAPGADAGADPAPELALFAAPPVEPVRAGPEPALHDLARGEPPALAPLPEAEREARGIAALFPAGEVALFVGAAATESAFRTEPDVRRAARLHLASHALTSERFPRYSAVVLGAGPGDDGLLQAFEVAGLSLEADLVVLSACRTGLGREVRGEGLMGLAHGFFQAGARRIVSSLWRVADDSTARLMEEFYRELQRGREPAAALRAAKLRQLAQPATAHPFHWAAFVTLGGLPAPAPRTQGAAEDQAVVSPDSKPSAKISPSSWAP